MFWRLKQRNLPRAQVPGRTPLTFFNVQRYSFFHRLSPIFPIFFHPPTSSHLIIYYIALSHRAAATCHHAAALAPPQPCRKPRSPCRGSVAAAPASRLSRAVPPPVCHAAAPSRPPRNASPARSPCRGSVAATLQQCRRPFAMPRLRRGHPRQPLLSCLAALAPFPPPLA